MGEQVSDFSQKISFRKRGLENYFRLTQTVAANWHSGPDACSFANGRNFNCSFLSAA